MNNVRKQKRANKSLPFFFKDEFKVSFIIIFISTILLIATFSFDIVPPILNRGIQPATFPKALLVLIISLTFVVYFLSTKKPWKVEKKLPKTFYLTLTGFLLFVLISKTLDFFLAISILSVFVSYCWGERRIFYLLLVSIIFPIIVFIFFETILGLRFPPGIITNIYYQV
ncbi:tripartite tricarboxylate transporter TctB family protein [Candidatus Pelagibacter sp.]|nr:tripartite tricarboxylate transporter TctB family protein [Candidatus Pelagibacter sp.]MDC3288237.1 tripartite tricarboxylate transporter TctB family protein [Candidatus Pelagibacter sp.]